MAKEVAPPTVGTIPFIVAQNQELHGNFQSYGQGSIYMAHSEKEVKSMTAAGYGRRATTEEVEAVKAKGAKPADAAEVAEARAAAKREKR